MVLLITFRLLSFRASSQHRSCASVISKIQPMVKPSVNNPDISDITPATQSDVLKLWIAPLANSSYTDQLEMKQDWILYVISQYKNIFQERCRLLERSGHPPNPNIQNICPSPVIEKYRNKDSYVVQMGIDGNPKTVGHVVGSSSKSNYVCIPPVDVISPSKHIEIAKAFQEYIRLSSLPACHNFKDGGFWREICVRTNSQGDSMLIVYVNPRGLTENQLQEEKNKIRDYFVDGSGHKCGLNSLYFQACLHTRCNTKDAPLQLLHGESHLMESLHTLMFALSPSSFFQVNKNMAEILYERIISLARMKPSTTLLDLCCGIGVVSILSSPFVRGSVGVDICEDAIKDAEHNCSLNKIHTSKFISGKIESMIPQILQDVNASSDLVVVLNPGRGGVYKNVIEALRKVPQIRTVIYVSCQPDHAFVVENVIKLLIPSGKRDLGKPFRLKKVVPVDMFPQTKHCEVILCFER